MKKIFYILAIFTMLFLSVYGQPPPPPPHQHGKKPHEDKLGPDPMHFFRKAGITLTSAQTNRIYDIAIKFVNDEKSIRIKIEEIDYNIKNELIKDNPDRNILRDLIKRKKEIEAERDCLIIFRDLDIIGILTPEQRVQLNKYKK
ncbi:periplasmic heavy metal sensor [Brachyspira aalborgi]|uniref:Spy/CpxP family protein refolding chaperone n=1 Tax=Brachyspira aalborgi TaxID=29522 RepID=UPI0011C9553C|nr:periplasmic heavy metal sensor [Brachyspira aalborgi]TXJ16812.1 periplasmic heavy metal sensor [Brachyspira aalborgi]TXJ22213.1 periplasmic heavy metal sensor [Brachyspira aalborgi]TXJ51011.1 periplasmic heavy metal sensor [Brachyspira aalborgi]